MGKQTINKERLRNNRGALIWHWTDLALNGHLTLWETIIYTTSQLRAEV